MKHTEAPWRVMLLCTNLARGGAETQVALLAMELQRRGHNVSVVSMLPPTAFVEELEAVGVDVETLGMRAGKPGLGGVWRFARILRKARPHVLHAHLFHANLLARLARLIFPVPVVISTVHSLSETGRTSENARGRDGAYRATDWLSDRTAFVSGAAAERHLATRAVTARRACMIPNGVPPKLYAARPGVRKGLRSALGAGDAFVWLAAGRLMWKKDYVTMLEAMARIPHGILWIAGEGPLEAALRERAAPLGNRVRFLGLRDDVPDLMQACDGFLLSSVVEGLPMVLIEAAMAGLPAVGTDVGGVREVIVDGQTGFLVPAREPAALASAIERVASLPEPERLKMADAARDRARTCFAIETVASHWEGLYGDCLSVAARQLLP